MRTITTGLDGPYGLDITSSREEIVAEADSGEVTTVNLGTGTQRTILSGLAAPAGVARHDGNVYVVLGGGGEGGAYPPSSLLKADKNGAHVRVLADLMAYELKHNPDGQVQFDPQGNPYDALSNPFSMTYTKWGLLVANGSANDVLRVDPRTGKISRPRSCSEHRRGTARRRPASTRPVWAGSAASTMAASRTLR